MNLDGQSPQDQLALGSEQFDVALGPRQTLLGNNALGLNYFPDMNVVPLRQSPSLELFVAAGKASYLLEGSDLTSLTKSTLVLGAGTAGGFDGGGAWICGQYRHSDGKLYVFYHAEDQTGMPLIQGTIPGFYASIGVAVSTDNGRTFTGRQQIISGFFPKNTANGAAAAQGIGECSVVVDPTGRYLYAYYTTHYDHYDHTPAQTGTQIALARVDISQGSPSAGRWQKYYNGGFGEPGLGGRESPIVAAPGGSGHAINPAVSYSTHLGRYVMAYAINDYAEYDTFQPVDSGIYLTFSTDGIRWGAHRMVLPAWSIPLSGREVAIHPAIVWDDAQGSTGGGWLVYGHSSSWNRPAHAMAGQRITVSPLASSRVPRSLLAAESFTYASGSLANRVSTASFGFDGLWTAVSNTAVVTAGSLGYGSLPQIGNHVAVGQNGRLRRRLDTSVDGPFARHLESQGVVEGGLFAFKPLIGATGTVLYASFLQSMTALDGFAAVEFQRADYSDSTLYSPNREYDGNRTVFVGHVRDQNSTWFGAASDFNGGVAQTLGSPSTDSRLIVIKFEFGTNDNDKVSIYVNPAADAEPAAPTAVLFGNFAFDRISVANFVSSTNVHRVDELRLSSTFLSAVNATFHVPTDITIGQAAVSENLPADSLVGRLSTADADVADSFTYELVAGSGSTDNGLFRIVGDQLRTAAVLDYESRRSHDVRVRSTDRGGLSVERSVTIAVGDVDEPTVPDSAPSAVSIDLSGPHSPQATSLSWKVTFSADVTGVDPSDFRLVFTGATVGSQVTVTGSGASYVVTALGIAGPGTVALTLIDDGSIRDAAGRRLVGRDATARPFGALPTRRHTTGAAPRAIAVADVNQDSKPDLLTVDANGRTVSVFRGNGDGTFADRLSFGTGFAPSSLAVADVNGDRHADILVANFGSDTLGLLLGNGDGTFQAQRTVGTGSGPAAVTIADVNDDSRPDVVAVNEANHTVSVLLGDGKGAFAGSLFGTGTYPVAVQVADVDRDGKPDIITANRTNSVSVLLGRGDGSFQPARHLSAGVEPRAVVVGDVNGDLNPDILTGNLGSRSVGVFLGTGDGGFSPAREFDMPAGIGSVTVGDVNADGFADVMAGSYIGERAFLLAGRGDGTFQPPLEIALGGEIGATAIGDLNGDGRADLLATLVFADAVTIALNAGQGSLASTPTTVTTPFTRATAATITATTPGDGRVTVAWNPPVSNGGSAILAYAVHYAVAPAAGQQPVWKEWGRVNASARSAVVTGLVNGTGYLFRISALNAAGYGLVQPTAVPVVPFSRATAVTITATTPGDGRVSVAWNPPVSNGGSAIRAYAVQYAVAPAPGQQPVWKEWGRTTASARSAVVTGLVNGTGYLFRISALNAAGYGLVQPTAVPAVPFSRATAATITATTPGDGRVTVAWNPPSSDGGSAIRGYAVQYAVAPAAGQQPVWKEWGRTTASARSAVVTGLVNGTGYLFRISALNAAGYGAVQPTTTPVVPRAPTSNGSPYNTTITVRSGTNTVNGDGITLVSHSGSSISYNTIESTGTPFNIKLFVSNVQVALLTAMSYYMGRGFTFTREMGESYQGTFEADGRVDL